jgi:hypothetical protein
MKGIIIGKHDFATDVSGLRAVSSWRCHVEDVVVITSSPVLVKYLRTDIYFYVGPDVQEDKQSDTPKTVADEYLITTERAGCANAYV